MSNTTTSNLTPSELGWLHADQIAPSKTFNDWATTALLSGTEVSMKQLAQTLIAVALLANESAGAIRLEPRTKKTLFGLRSVQTLYAEPAGTTTWPEGSLEARVLSVANTLHGAKGRNEISTLVNDLFTSDVANPWGGVLEIVGNAMEARGLLGSEQVKRLKIFSTAAWTIPDTTREQAAAQPVAAVTALLQQAQGRADVWKLLAKQIEGGLKGRVEQDNDMPDSSSD